MSGCTRGCGKKKKRDEKRRSQDTARKIGNKLIETEYISGDDDPSDLDSVITGTANYKAVAGKSGQNNPKRKDRKNYPEEKGKRGKQSSKKIRDENYSEQSYASTAREKIPKKKRNTPRAASSDEYSSEATTRTSTKTSRQCTAASLLKYVSRETSETETFDEDEDGRGCEDEECGRDARLRSASRRREISHESSESSSEEVSSTDDSEKCPELCETDPSKLPEEKPKKCDSSCRKQEWLQRQRQRRQDEMDDYLLRKGFRYFDDMCKCSFKCLMSQIYVDPFVRNVAFSTVGFFLGIKLCWELDGFYVLF